MGAAVNAQLGRADTLLLGRRTYDTFAGAWPERERPAARTPPWPRRSATRARSWSRSQDLEFTWRNSELLRGDLVEAVTALKNEPGGTTSR